MSAEDSLVGAFSFSDASQEASLRVSAGVGAIPLAIVPPLIATATSTLPPLPEKRQDVPLNLRGGPNVFPVVNSVELSGTLKITLKNDGRNRVVPKAFLIMNYTL